MINNDQLMTLDEVAKFLKVSRPTIYRKVKSGEIPAKKIGRSWRFLKSDLMQLVKVRRNKLKKEVVTEEPLPFKDAENIEKICKENYIGLCYLFGSSIDGTFGDGSDIDIGVVFLPNVNIEETYKLFTEIKEKFFEMVKPAEADLIFLQKVGPMIQEQAINGRCIYTVSDFFKTRYEDVVAREAMDFRFFQQQFDKDMIEDIKKGGFFVA